MEKSEITKLLRESVQAVEFVKADGSTRHMRCTLMEAYLPNNDDLTKTVSKSATKSNPDVVACWDLDAKGWRSFRIDSVVNMVTFETFL